jgi:hypothetical protein
VRFSVENVSDAFQTCGNQDASCDFQLLVQVYPLDGDMHGPAMKTSENVDEKEYDDDMFGCDAMHEGLEGPGLVGESSSLDSAGGVDPQRLRRLAKSPTPSRSLTRSISLTRTPTETREFCAAWNFLRTLANLVVLSF